MCKVSNSLLHSFDEDDFDHDTGSDLSEMSDLSDDDDDGEDGMEDDDMMQHHHYHSGMEDDEVSLSSTKIMTKPRICTSKFD